MSSLRIKLAKFGALSWSDRRAFFSAWAWLPLFWLGLRVLGLQRFQRWLAADSAQNPCNVSVDDMRRLGSLVNSAARWTPFPATCLTRSLLLRWWLQRRGVASALRIGVRINQDIFAAHAWVEYQGVPINDEANVGEQFAAFKSL
jgi:hypothetical protein